MEGGSQVMTVKTVMTVMTEQEFLPVVVLAI
jgi:hypothetical protein